MFELFRAKGDSQVDAVEGQIEEMLRTTHSTFTMAIDALMRRVEPEDNRRTIRKADKSVNKVERAIRRSLVVHAGVHGALADVPVLLVYMSISKDIERIGDITKDMWDLADAGVDLSTVEDSVDIDGHASKIAGLILDAATIFAERDGEAAAGYLNSADELRDEYERLMLSQLESDQGAQTAVSRALLYRYINRIVSHLMNVLTAVVMPLDRLDYWDEDRMDRE